MLKLLQFIMLICLLFYFESNVAFSQLYLQWNKTYSGTANNSDDRGNDLVIDNSGNVIIVGSTSTPATGLDFIILKYTSEGDTVWKRTFNTGINNNEEAVSVAADENNNYYVTGYSYFSGQQKKIITIKYNSSGNIVWPKVFNYRQDSISNPAKILINNNGDLYVCGYSQDINGKDALVIKYDAISGDTIWVRTFNNYANRDDEINAMIIDNNQNIVIGGFSSFAPGASDYLLVKFSSDGNFNWVKYYRVLGTQTNVIYALKNDLANNIYVTGKTYYYSPGPPGYEGTSYSYSATIKYNENGDTLWKKLDGGAHYLEYGAFSLTVDSVGNSFICGNGQATIKTLKYGIDGSLIWRRFYAPPYNHFGGKGICVIAGRDNSVYSAGYLPVSDGNGDIFLFKYDYNNGALLWSTSYGSSQNKNDILNKVIIDKFDNIYLLGFFTASSNDNNILLLKYNDRPNGIISNSNIIPGYYSLSQNYPNPFNPLTVISYQLAVSNVVNLKVYAALGKEVATLVNEKQNAGSYSVEFNGEGLPSGVYYYKLEAGDFVETKRMVLLK